jgi:hypothetical protein
VSFSSYAWIIDTDHLADDGSRGDAGMVGPRDANGGTKEALSRNYSHHHQFRMFDDDQELYYTGTLFWNGDAANPSEEYVYGPLGDYGMPGAGCVLIAYTDKPEWDCG